MTSTTKDQELHTYLISCDGVGGIPAPDKKVQAAYFQHDEEFTVFKDASGKAVLAIKSKIIRMIERAAPARSNGSGEA